MDTIAGIDLMSSPILEKKDYEDTLSFTSLA